MALFHYHLFLRHFFPVPDFYVDIFPVAFIFAILPVPFFPKETPSNAIHVPFDPVPLLQVSDNTILQIVYSTPGSHLLHRLTHEMETLLKVNGTWQDI